MTSRCPHCSGTHNAENHFCPVSGQPIELGPRLISQTLLELFRVVTILGEGPIGIVVEVEERNTGKRFAAKLIHPQYTRDPAAADKVLEDAKKAGSLGCENIAEVVKVGRDTGAALTVIRELMTGQCLEAYLEEKKKLPVDEAIGITQEILNALDAIHEASIVNLDLSPADVFLADAGQQRVTKLVDIGERHIKQELVLENNEELDSRNYYAPEQYDLSRQISPRSDVYAAGAILYRMLTGMVPSGDPKPISEVREDVGTGLAQVVNTAIAPTPGNRFHSAAEFKQALDRAKAEPDAAGAAAAPPPPEAPSVEVDASLTEEQPSVIVDMPEMDTGAVGNRTKGLIVAVLLAVVTAIAIIFVLTSGSDSPDGQDSSENLITITIKVDPERADVTVDGKRIEGNPLTLEVAADKTIHTVVAKADGYEPLERDVTYNKSKEVSLSLTEVIQPDEPDSPTEEVAQEEQPAEDESPDVVEIVEPDEEPTPAPEPKKAVAAPPAKPKPAKKSGWKKPAAKRPKAKKPAAPAKKAPAKKPAPQPKKTKPKKKSREGFSTSNPFG